MTVQSSLTARPAWRVPPQSRWKRLPVKLSARQFSFRAPLLYGTFLLIARRRSNLRRDRRRICPGNAAWMQNSGQNQSGYRMCQYWHHRNKAAVHIFGRQRKCAQRNNLCVAILMQCSRKSVLRMDCRSARRCKPVKKRSCPKAAVRRRTNKNMCFCRLWLRRQKRNLSDTSNSRDRGRHAS